MIAYHYTNIESFRSIIETGKIRLTNVLNQNDYTESIWINNIINTVVSDYRSSYPQEFWNAFYSQHRLEENIYTFSFSADNDSLSQWRAYSNDGAGLAIGFNIDTFAKKIDTSSHNFFELWDDLVYTNIDYNEQKQQEYVKSVFDWGVSEIKRNNQWYIPALVMTLWNKLDALGVKIKHPKYFEEHEIRIIKQANRVLNEKNEFYYESENKKVIWKTGKYGLARCIEASIDLSKAISEIVVGPKLIENSNSILTFLADSNINNITCRKSQCPYR